MIRKHYTKRNRIFGIGVNDADYPISWDSQGKREYCIFYVTWHSMIRRCYSSVYHSKKPTYKGCSVCPQWLFFLNFKTWMVNQEWKGMQLDKDILIHGNKIYSPKTCLFVTREVNGLLANSLNSIGDLPTGVTIDKRWNKNYVAKISISGRRKSLGVYNTAKEAHHAYIKAKAENIINIANRQKDHRVKDGLLIKANIIMKS